MTAQKPVILQVLPSLQSGGVERGTIEVARAIAAKGWVSLVASSGGKMAAQLSYAGAEHITLPLASKNPFVIWQNSRKLKKIIRDRGVDIIHARSRAPAWSTYLAAKKTDCKFITTFHGYYKMQNVFKHWYNSVMVRGQRVIAISHFIADHIRKNYTVEAERVRIIHRGVDLKLFHSTTHSPERMIRLAKEWHLPDEPVILFPGRLTRWKGQDVFIKALEQIPHRHFFAVILGDDKGHPNYRTELEKLIISSGLAGHVRIIPHTQQITDAYRLARVVVATSVEPEPFGRVVLEAQAMARPVIATNQGGPQETIVPNETGWLVEPGNVNELSNILAFALAMQEEDLRVMGDQAVANAANFSLDAMCQKTLAVYEELLGQEKIALAA
jgi:glycosyltransferase involved in cell wall biosynthesis